MKKPSQPPKPRKALAPRFGNVTFPKAESKSTQKLKADPKAADPKAAGVSKKAVRFNLGHCQGLPKLAQSGRGHGKL